MMMTDIMTMMKITTNLWQGDHEDRAEEGCGGEEQRNGGAQVLTASEQHRDENNDDQGDVDQYLVNISVRPSWN